MTDDRTILEQAIDWHVRQAELSGAEWHAFIDWLEADAAHAATYDRVALLDNVVADLPQLRAANDEPALVVTPTSAPRRWWWGVGGTAIAAGIAALVMPLALPRAAAPYTIITAPGEHRTIALEEGTRVELSGDTAMRFDRNDPRVAQLDRGEALFTVRHDAARPFAVRSGAITVQDVGTVFNVVRDKSRLDVQVAEGSVLFQPGADRITLTAGNALSLREDTHSLALTKVAADSVGSWRSGRIVAQGQPVGAVAAAITRANGAKMTLSSGLSAMPFTGMVRLTGAAEQDVPHFAALIGAKWRRDGEEWVLAPAQAQAQGATR